MMKKSLFAHKVLVVTNIPNPYRIPLFNEMKRQFDQLGTSFKVIFGARGYSRRKWDVDMKECKFDYEILSSRKITLKDSERTIFTYPGLLSLIKRENPAAIISSGFSLATTKLWFQSWLKQTPFIVWSGTIHNRYRPVSFWRKIQRRLIVKRAAGFVSYGTKAKDYLISLGAKPEKVSIGINTVDTEFFRRETEKLKKNEPFDRKKALLYVGYFVSRKRIDLLLRIVRNLSRRRNDFILRLVGDGPEKGKLEKLARELDVAEHISFEGFQQKKHLPRYFAQADCFLFPSEYDYWGLVLVEAMAAGIPCIASIHAGATHDLIEDGVNGFAMDFSDVERVAEIIDRILNNPRLQKKISLQASQFISENVSLRKSAEGFVQMAHGILKDLSK